MSRRFRFVIVACGWSAYPRHLNFLRFEQIANDVSAGERSGDERGARGSGIRVLTGRTDVHLVVPTSASRRSMASRPRIACTKSGSPSTATRCRSTRVRR